MMSENYKLQQQLDALFYPLIRVVPNDDWSALKAIWIPFLHHDYKNQLERSEKITILDKKFDKFGTIQGYLLARNENYLPYKTTFFNPLLTQTDVIEKILQADANIIETQTCIVDETKEHTIRSKYIGITKSGMFITLIKNNQNQIIDAYPIFDTNNNL